MTEENKSQDHDQHDQIVLLKQYLENAQANIHQAYHVLAHLNHEDLDEMIKKKIPKDLKEELTKNAKIVEGIFDGESMIGPDGKVYSIAPNYASKSKLIEGDILKLTIMPDGSFLYKQIKPVERKRIVGSLIQDPETNEYKVLAKGRSYKVILASVTYFKGEVGDQVVILVPEDQDSKWAAVENIIKEKKGLTTGSEAELESGDDMELKSGAETELESGADMELKSGVDLELGSGFDLELPAGKEE